LHWRLRLLPILSDARRTEAGEAVLVDAMLPGEEFVDRQCVSGAGLFKRQKATAHSGLCVPKIRFCNIDGEGRRERAVK